MIRTDYNLPIFEDTDIADLNNYTTEMANALKTQIDKFGNPLVYKGVLQTLAELTAITNANQGEIYGVVEDNKNYVWNGTIWAVYSNNMIESALPTGGTAGQVLTKQSSTDGDADWETIEANEVYIGDEATAPESAKLVIDPDEIQETGLIPQVIDNLDSTSIINSLSANQGRVLGTYSTDEVRVGTWIDGKPLYRKVLDIGNITLDANYTITFANVGITNVDMCLIKNAYVYSSTAPKIYRPITWKRDNTATDAYAQSYNTGVSIYVGSSNMVSFTNLLLILEYTKTTD